MGVGAGFIQWIRLLYAYPTARIQVNGKLSASFRLYRGTRQRCPLSPLLFAVAVEPLAAALRKTSEVKGMVYGALTEKVDLYADDLLLFLENWRSSLPAAMSIINDFGKLSGLSINWSKSVIMTLSPNLEIDSCHAAGLQVVSTFKYLGIQVSAQINVFANLNILPLLDKFREKVQVWSKLPLTLIGRTNLLKMILLPQLLYILHNAPTWIPLKIFYTVNAIFRDLIWKKGNPRIKLATLCRTKTRGGLGVPDPWAYYLAAQLQHIRGWGESDTVNTVGRIVQHLIGGRCIMAALEDGTFDKMGGQYSLPRVIHKVWWKARNIAGIRGYTNFTLIWPNYAYKELDKGSGYQGLGTIWS